MRKASQRQEQSSSKVEDLSAWRNLEQEVEVSGGVVDTGLVVEDLPWSSRWRLWTDEELSVGLNSRTVKALV